jgi:hypothetical protein
MTKVGALVETLVRRKEQAKHVNDAQMERSLLCSQRKCSAAIGNQGSTMPTFAN